MNFSLQKIYETLNDQKFKFKKKFGQNFIIEKNIVEKIVKNALVDQNCLVIEIGPGMGALTVFLAEKAKNVLCYEIDDSLKLFLDELVSNYNNIQIKYEDFLKSNVSIDIKAYSYEKLYIVANLPYYITTPILEKIIEDNIPVDKIVVMVQKEVADRFKAKPGSRDYGSLTVYLNYYFDVNKLMDVSRNVFYPKPNVDSSIIEFKSKKVIKLNDKKLFYQIVKDSFKQKRKTIKNNLKGYDLSKIEEVLKKYNYDLSVRAENLSVDIFIEIANYLGVNNDK